MNKYIPAGTETGTTALLAVYHIIAYNLRTDTTGSVVVMSAFRRIKVASQ